MAYSISGKEVPSVFLKFIGYFIESFSLEISKLDWVNILKDKINSASNIKELALALYYIRIASIKDCVGVLSLVNLSHSKLRDFVIETEKIRESFGLTKSSVTFYTTDEKAIQHMSEFEGSEKTVEKILKKSPIKAAKKSPITTGSPKSKSSKKLPKPDKNNKTDKSKKTSKKSPKADKISKAKKSTTSKVVTSPKADKLVKAKKPSAPSKVATSPKSDNVAKTSKKSVKSPKSMKASVPRNRQPVKGGMQQYKNCNRYTIAQLKKLAADNDLDLELGLKKAELCEVIKEAGLLDIVIPTKIDIEEIKNSNFIYDIIGNSRIIIGAKKGDKYEPLTTADQLLLAKLKVPFNILTNKQIEKKIENSGYIYDIKDDSSIIIGTKKSGKYEPLTVSDRLLLAKLKVPFNFLTNKQIEKMYFFRDLPKSKIPYNVLGNTKANYMELPAVPIKKRAPPKKITSPTVIFEKKKARNMTKNAALEAKFEKRQLLSYV